MPDAQRAVTVQDIHGGHVEVSYGDDATVGDVARDAAEKLGLRVGSSDSPGLAIEGTGLHPSEPMRGRIDTVYDLYIIGGVV